MSANVIGEVTGREKPDEVVVVSGHLDSWDLGTGAIDDGAGCAIAIEAARLIAESPRRPRRTIRVVLYANEESGLAGGKGYAARHAAELSKHAGAFEADSGTGAPHGFSWNAADTLEPALAAVAKLLEPLGAGTLRKGGAGGADVSPMAPAGVPLFGLQAGDRDATSTFTTRPTTRSTRSKPPRSTRRPSPSPRWPTRWRTSRRSTSAGRAGEGDIPAVTGRRRRKKGRSAEGAEPGPLPEAPSQPSRLVRGTALLLAVLAAAFAAYLSQKLFSGMPRIGDEVSYAFQGRILASGRLFLAPPAVPEAFAVQHVIQTADRWCGKYPPGLPLLLATGWLVHAPWLVNPVLFGIAVYGLFRLGSKLWGPPTGLLGAFLFATLPFGFLQAASFLSHIASLACVTWCLVLLAEGGPARSRPLLLAAGFLGGFAVLVRPVSAVALLVGPVLLLLWQVPRWRDRLRAAGLLIVGSLLPLAFLLWVQWRSFGNPFLTGYAAYDPLESFLATGMA